MNDPVHKKEYDKARYQRLKKKINKVKSAWYAKHREQVIAQTSAYRKAHPIPWMLRRAKERAKRLGIEFNLTASDLSPLPTYCPVLGIKLIYFHNGVGGRDNSASLDRVLPHRGYVSGNVAIISNKANCMKRDNTPETLDRILKYIERTAHA